MDYTVNGFPTKASLMIDQSLVRSGTLEEERVVFPRRVGCYLYSQIRAGCEVHKVRGPPEPGILSAEQGIVLTASSCLARILTYISV